MSPQKDLLLRVAAGLSAGDLDRVGDWFTEDFRLHEPTVRGRPAGHEGARLMLAAIRDLVPGLRAEVLDMVEEGDRVAVRWLLSGAADGEPRHLSAVAIYRFAGGRIAEDWGVAARADWPEAGG